VDELDKISRKSENPSITRERLREGVQQALLKILKARSRTSRRRATKAPQQKYIEVNPRTSCSSAAARSRAWRRWWSGA